MLGLTPLGTIHTFIALIAVAAGFTALFRHKEISPLSRSGRIYILMTVLTCLTGFGIFQHGGFNKAHVLGIVTLAVLALAYAACRTNLFGSAARYVETVGYSLTFYFHFIPAMTETSIRLPIGAPLSSGPDDPNLVKAAGILFVVFLIGATLQVRRLWR